MSDHFGVSSSHPLPPSTPEIRNSAGGPSSSCSSTLLPPSSPPLLVLVFRFLAYLFSTLHSLLSVVVRHLLYLLFVPFFFFLNWLIKLTCLLHLQTRRIFRGPTTTPHDTKYVVVGLHYSPVCEVVHWILDYAHVKWQESSWGVLFVGPVVKFLSSGCRSGGPLTILPNGSWIGDAADVVRHIASTDRGIALFPNEMARTMFNELADLWTFGEPAMHLCYGLLFSDEEGLSLMESIWVDSRFVGFKQRQLVRLMKPYVRYVMKYKAKWTQPEVIERNRGIVDGVWNKINSLLQEGEAGRRRRREAEVGGEGEKKSVGGDEEEDCEGRNDRTTDIQGGGGMAAAAQRTERRMCEETANEVQRSKCDAQQNGGVRQQQGRQRRLFIAGTEKPTAVDILFSSLAYPLVLPAAMAERFLPLSQSVLPPLYFEEVKRRRESPAGRLVQCMYREYRHKKEEDDDTD
eukprot:GHVS01086318.1.p1 GENE.GHVS01086318.1~~GHVS01086318.1.p1  ORF type:complete len:500 (+),score=131.27 GHVS01086318.1:122-1501(+)